MLAAGIPELNTMHRVCRRHFFKCSTSLVITCIVTSSARLRPRFRQETIVCRLECEQHDTRFSVMSMQILLAVDSWIVFWSGQPCSVRDVVPTCLRTELATTFDRRTAMGSWVCVECTGRLHGVGIGPFSKLGQFSIKVVRSEVLDHANSELFWLKLYTSTCRLRWRPVESGLRRQQPCRHNCRSWTLAPFRQAHNRRRSLRYSIKFFWSELAIMYYRLR